MSLVAERVLDRAVWNTLGAAHARLALGGDRARRFCPDVAPFADIPDESPASLAALADLVAAGETLLTMSTPSLRVVPGLAATVFGNLRQMVARTRPPAVDRAGIVELTAADIPDMRALADLTHPGPFEARTSQLGRFYGIRRHGELVAMAGERMKPTGFTEISAVTTRADHRKQGIARRLVEVLETDIFSRGETPFLHVLETNVNAERLYLDMGFEIRLTTQVIALQKPTAAER